MRSPFRIALGTFFLLTSSSLFGADAPAPLSRFVPANDLILYAEYDGVDAHTAAWKKSSARALLNDSSLGDLTEHLLAQSLEIFRQGGQNGLPRVDSTIATLKNMAKGGFAVGFIGKSPQDWKGVIAIRSGKGAELGQVFNLYLNAMSRSRSSTLSMKAGRQVSVAPFPNGTSWAIWHEGEDHVICEASLVDLVLETADGKKPNASKNPKLIALAKPEADFESIARAFVDPVLFVPASPESAKLGLDGIKGVDARIGFEGNAMKTITRVVAPSPRKGVLTLLDTPSFSFDSLPPLPAGLTGFTALSIEPAKLYDQILALMESSSETPAQGIKVTEIRLKQALKIDLKRDFLAHLGPKVAIYAMPMKAGAEGLANSVLDFRMSVAIDDPVAVGKAVDTLVEAFNAPLKPGFQPAPAGVVVGAVEPPARDGTKTPGFHKAEGAVGVYTLTLPPDATLPGPLEAIEPTIIVGKDRLVVAMTRNAAESAVTVGNEGKALWTPPTTFNALATTLPKNAVFLNIHDPRETFPRLVASLPFLLESMNKAVEQINQGNGMRQNGNSRLPIEIDPTKVPMADELEKPLFPGWFAIATDSEGMTLVTRDAFPNLLSPTATGLALAVVLPAVQSSREAARRADCVNHLKQLGLAMHNYHSATNSFPKRAITDKDGKPLLSWRVAILPYLEQQALYNKFKLDEPWDSPNNKPLLDEMPEVFRCTSAPKIEPKGTNYRVFFGNGALFDEKDAVGLANVLDGTSNTIMVVETKDTVPWTKPDDLEFDPKKAGLLGAGSFHPGGFNALLADGAVRFIKSSVNMVVLRAIITRAGGEVVSGDAY